MRKFWGILFFLLPIISFGQEIEYLHKELMNAVKSNDTSYYLLSKKIASYYSNFIPDSAIFYINNAIAVANSNNAKNESLDFLLLKAKIQENKCQYSNAISTYFEALNLIAENTNSRIYADILLSLSDAFLNANFKSETAKKYLFQALDIAKFNNDIECQINASLLLSKLYGKEGIKDTAIIFIDKAVELGTQLNNNFIKSQTYFFLAQIYSHSDEYLKASTYIKKSISLSDSNEYKYMYLTTLAEIYASMGHYPAAENVFNEVLIYYELSNNVIGIIHVYQDMADLYYYQGEYDKAITYAQSALKLSKNLDILAFQVESYYKLSEIYSEYQQIDLALYSYKKYSELRDSTFMENTKNESELLFSNYVMQLKLKDQQILYNQKQYQILKNRQQALVIYILAIVGILLVITLFILLKSYFAKKKNEIRLKELTEATLEGLIIHNGIVILETNDKYCELTGYERNELIGKDLLSTISPRMRNTIKSKLNLKKTVYHSLEILRKDGSIFEAEVLSKPFIFKGIHTKVVSIRDLSEIKQIKEKLHATKEQFEALIETSPDGVVITDFYGTITYVSPAFVEIFNRRTTDDLIGQKFSSLVSPIYENKVNVDLNNIMYGDYSGVTEYLASKNNNEEFYIECNGNVLKEINGNIIGVFLIVRDVSERKLVENALIESESRFRGLFNNAKDAIIIQDSDFKIIDANPYASVLLQYTLDDLLRMDFRELLPAEIKKNDYCNIEENGNLFESYIYTKNRKRIYIQVSVSKLSYSNDVNYILTIRDLSIIKRQEENLQRIAHKLQESNATKDKIFSIIGHDLRGPIGNLKTMIEFIAENPDEFDTNELIDTISSLRDTSTQTYELLENLLSWAKTQQNLHEFQPKVFDLEEAVQNTVGFSKQIAKSKNISIDINSDRNLFVIADENMIKAVVRNLISNAIKFTKPKGHIDVNLVDDTDIVTVNVKDSGIGISADNLPKIFKDGIYFSTYGTNNEKGTGLGLKLCYDFVQKNNGKIWVESEPGVGTSFFFTIKKV